MEIKNKNLSKQLVDQIEASRQVILDELKPTKAQLERGLELHRRSYVADACGGAIIVMKKWRSEWSRLIEMCGVDMVMEEVSHPGMSLQRVWELLAHAMSLYEGFDKVAIAAKSFKDILQGWEKRKPCVMVHMSDPDPWANASDPLKTLDLLYSRGVRCTQIAYGTENKIGSSWIQQDKGLTALGRQAVRRMNQLGMIIDLAHIGPVTAMDLVEASDNPVIVTHTGCKKVYDPTSNPDYVKREIRVYDRSRDIKQVVHSRNLDDDVLQAIAKKGGVIGIYVLNHLVTPGSAMPTEKGTTWPHCHACSFNMWWKHMEHAINTVGVDHVILGSDWGLLFTEPTYAMDWINLPYFTVGMICRGLSDRDIQKILGLNYLRFLSKKPWGPFTINNLKMEEGDYHDLSNS